MRARFQDPRIFSFLVSRRVNRIASPFGTHRILGTSDEVAGLRILEPGTHAPEIIIGILALVGSFMVAVLTIAGSLGGVLLGARLSAKSQRELAELDREQQLRLAALDKRLEVHQDAYRLWKLLVFSLYKDELRGVVGKCQDFWDQNCLYMEPRTREEFQWCMHFAPLFTDRKGQERMEWWDRLMNASVVIASEVGLPPIKETGLPEMPPKQPNEKGDAQAAAGDS